MKAHHYPRLLVIAGTTSTLFLGGCASEIVAEREVVGEMVSTSCPGIYRARTVRRLEPVGEHYEIRRTILTRKPDQSRYYDPLLQSWESPWPYGPYSSTLRN